MNKTIRNIIIISVSVVMLLTTVLIGFIIKIFLNPGDPTLGSSDFEAVEYTEDSNVATVTFPEGYTVTQIAEKLEENQVCSAEDFLNCVKNPSDEILQKLGISNKEQRIFPLEGYVFPDTYEFYKGESAQSVLQRFVDNYTSKITDADRARAVELGYTMDQIITIASIIQEESGRVEQDYKVSSVLHNRLRTGTRIECDVTITYLEEYCAPYLPFGLTEDNRNNYNTYKCPALPAGPITNPGYASIQAALYPEQTDFLFFVTDADWNYYYAATWAEHVVNCRNAGIPGY